jgi:hypothetical protein
MGTLIALLWEPCDGTDADHRAKFKSDVLTFEKRLAARQWAVGGGMSLFLLGFERDARADEASEEPQSMC